MMKKIVRQQNYLKSLIDSQENNFITKQSLKCALRAILEPLLDNPEEGVVLYRIFNLTGLKGLIKRIEFSKVESYSFSDDSDNLREKVWAGTEFLCVLTHRFVSIFIWDEKTESKNYVRYYSIWNSKIQNEALDIIARNSLVDIKAFQESFKPDRRDNILMNSSIRRLFENMDEGIKDAVLGYAEYNAEPKQYTPDVREISHEIRNQLSICDLYTEIIKKYCENNNIKDETILNGVKTISRSIQLSANSLISLKSTQPKALVECDMKNIVEMLKDLTKVYFECKNVEYSVESKANLKVMADEESLLSVLVNLVKNAVEAFGLDDEDANKNGKYVSVKAEKRGEFAAIRIQNNAEKVSEPDKIFEKGYTTKSTGSGLGLGICKKVIEELNGEIRLDHSNDDYTEFLIKLKLI